MDVHPLTNHEIARLRCEERLLRAQAARRATSARDRREDAPAQAQRDGRLRALWKRVGVFSAGVFLATAPVALAHHTTWAWTDAKAERIVRAEVTLMLPAAQRAALEKELRESAAYFGALAIAAAEQGGGVSGSVYSALANRFRAARGKVRAGLAIAAAECTGSGAAFAGKRFKHFRCSATSELLQIPNVTVVDADGPDLPKVVEDQPRTVGPVEATLYVHVTGRSIMTARRLSQAGESATLKPIPGLRAHTG